VDEEDEHLARKIPKAWSELYVQALFRGQNLEATKEKFKMTTREEVNNFLFECDAFLDRFYSEGPPGVGEDLDKGIKLMDVSLFVKRILLLALILKNPNFKTILKIAQLVIIVVFVCLFFLQPYRIEFEDFARRVLDVRNAERLFDLPLSDVSRFDSAKEDFGYLEMIYHLYKAQKVSGSPA